MTTLSGAIYARLAEAREAQPKCTAKHPSSRPYIEDLELVVQLAMKVEGLSKREQSALLRVAHRVAEEINRVSLGNPLMFDDYGVQLRGFSQLEEKAEKSACLGQLKLGEDQA